MAANSIKELKDAVHLKMNKRLMCIFMTMSGVIKCQGLNLAFEYDYEGGLLLYNYKPCDHDNACDHAIDNIDTGLRINELKIECIDL